MTSSSRSSRLGTRFGPYELRSLIGTGGMGEVYRAYDTVKDRMVALKLLRGETAADPGFQQRLWRECRKVTGLRDPHVIPLHDFGEIDGVPFIDMHLVDDGGSLKDLLREQGALEPSRAASITAQVARALDAAHAAGLVHLDVKPENILLTHDHFTYLADFGIAQAAGDDNLSRTYMAPERFTTGRVGPQTDIYSLTCVLYECLTGQPPFDSEDAGELKRAHMLAPAPRPSIMRRGVGREYDDIITQGMAKQRAARFGSAGELARAASEAVFAAYEPVGVAAGRSGPPKTRPLPVLAPVEPDEPRDAPEPPPVSGGPRRWPAIGTTPLVVTAVAVVMLIAGLVLSVNLVGGTHHNASRPSQTVKAAAPPAPTTPPPPLTPTLSRPVKGADGLGFVGETARCDPGNPPAAVVRTAKSLAVVCQNLSGSYYYRGERIRDGAHIELSNAERAEDGFDVTNPVDGVVYEVRPYRLRIISFGHVDSSEPVLQFATAS
ncbi:protein kinase [Mycobacterium mantenii]|uniref:non-specific serine/threonine protein kinase n=1 Tax=Mycobacterium mantenii TaxID=560555 RepID=A0A1X0FAF1_MYCNT|nr:serine/threonine-protein kinase [Mycobacterium mantenii]MCV7245291.1 serine/threonine protein kinase [Mycobacterium mantenii]ORA98796.1 serine/threonine protein kinase [Mycobacterium mantenii]BBY37728.1 protein kinase [Mycobacterium mantenii]